MTSTSTLPMTDLYSQAQHFYARQMQALDDSRFEEYAATFTEDGSFQHTPTVPPAVTRTGIVAELVAFNKKYEGDPVRRRHWFNQIILEPRPDGGIASTVYAMIVRIRPGERPEIWPHCVLHDTLVVEDGGILMRSRVVTYDEMR